jgi:ferredoxin
MTAQLDWSAYPGQGGGFQGAVEMCNNNGACRASAGGVMCPSYRVTRQERDVTRGRANSLRLAITGQLGPDALTSAEMADTLKLCVSCKGCRRECPTGVDMARMKIEVQAARAEKHGLSLHDRLVGYLPRYAPYAARVPWLLNLRDVLPGAARLSEVMAGFSAKRSLPKWRSDIFDDDLTASLPGLTRQSIPPREKVDAWVIGERSDAVLRSAMSGDDVRNRRQVGYNRSDANPRHRHSDSWRARPTMAG